MAKAHPFHLVRRSSSAHRSPDPGEGWGRKPLLLHLAAFLLTALALLPVAVCQAQTYTIGEIAVTIVSYEPKQIELKWTTPPNPPTSGPPGTPGPNDPKKVPCGVSYGGLHRDPTGPAFPVPTGAPGLNSYVDTDWTVNTVYRYHIAGASHFWEWDAANMVWVHTQEPLNFPTHYVTVRLAVAAEMQTVDTRLDLRFSTYQLKNFNFGSETYRGGLFVGSNADNSRVARTYVKFTDLARGMRFGDKLWSAGSLHLYMTRTARPGSVTMLCRAAASDNWTPSTLTFADAPQPIVSGGASVSASWTTGGAGQWLAFNPVPDLEQALATDRTLSLVLLSASESSAPPETKTAGLGWAYFARSNFEINNQAIYSPRLVYAFGGKGASVSAVSVMPSTVTGGGSASGLVGLAERAPYGGVTVSLASNDPAVQVPATVTIPEGEFSAPFTVTTSSVGSTTTATITATLGLSKTANVTVNP